MIKGKVFKYGANINTDVIIPARYLNTSDPVQLAQHCLEDLDTEFIRRVRKGDIIVADKNFGCGSSREHAAIALKAAGISCVLARTFARIFYRNSFNTGLPVLESEEAVEKINPGDLIEIVLEEGSIKNISQGEEYQITPIPPFMQELIKAGGLLPFIEKQNGNF